MTPPGRIRRHPPALVLVCAAHAWLAWMLLAAGPAGLPSHPWAAALDTRRPIWATLHPSHPWPRATEPTSRPAAARRLPSESQVTLPDPAAVPWLLPTAGDTLAVAQAMPAVPPVASGFAESPAEPVATLSTPTPQVAPAQTPRRVQALADHRHCPPARHPAALRERGIEGAVLLRVKVDIEGRPADVQLLAGSGWRLFDDAALQQIRGCRFVPATQDGQAIDSWVEFPVRFALAG
jgi:protein TonB